MVQPLRLIAFALVVSACGGKILEERTDGGAAVNGGSATSDYPEPLPPSGLGSLPPSPTSHSDDPCATICESNGGCVGGQTDCYRHCGDDLRAASCSAEARAYLGCYADNVQFCSELPPVCESAYCAYTRCAGKVVPSYCR